MGDQAAMLEIMRSQQQCIQSATELLQSVCRSLHLDGQAQEAAGIVASTGRAKDQIQKLLGDRPASQVMEEWKRTVTALVDQRSTELEATLNARTDELTDRVGVQMKELEAKMLLDVDDTPASPKRTKTGADGQIMKRIAARLNDFEAQMTAQMQKLGADVDRKAMVMASTTRGGSSQAMPNADEFSADLNALKYDIGELKDAVNNTSADTAHVKRIVLGCERDMEDFTAAMDAVNVDLDEMRARLDSTHSIITSRQRVEATVTAEISTMRLDMGDMQEALKAHDAWMEDVASSLQECHQRCDQLGSDILQLKDNTQAKLDEKVNINDWKASNEDLDGNISVVREMVSSLRLDVDARKRQVDEMMKDMDQRHTDLHNETNTQLELQIRERTEAHDSLASTVAELRSDHNGLNQRHEETLAHLLQTDRWLADTKAELESSLSASNAGHRKDIATRHREMTERCDEMERASAKVEREHTMRMNTIELRISGLQGITGENKRDITKLREEVNSLTVKAAAHEVEIAKCQTDTSKLERYRAEDVHRHKRDMDSVYEELDKKLYESSFITLEELCAKLTRGVVKLSQVIGVFPGARMEDGTDNEIDIDVELLNWQDCCVNMVARVEKMWRQQSSQRHRSVLDLVHKKADHSVMRLLQISHQHIEGQLERARHERELWKEVVEKRNQQPLQLALTLKDPSGAALPPTLMMEAPMNHPMVGRQTPRAMLDPNQSPQKPPTPPGQPRRGKPQGR